MLQPLCRVQPDARGISEKYLSCNSLAQECVAFIEHVYILHLVYHRAEDERRVDNDEVEVEVILSTELGHKHPCSMLGEGL